MSSQAPISIDFRQPSNKEELLTFLGVKEDVLDRALEEPNVSLRNFLEHRIPKKSFCRFFEYRRVWEASPILEDMYKAFTRRFDLFLRDIFNGYPHPSAFGYVRGRSTIDNASKHVGKKYVLHADIENFFPTITAERIHASFIELGLKYQVADILKRFLTIGGTLPLGLSPSPMIANLVCLELDNKLQKLAQSYGCEYTRYADDISISGNREIPTKAEIEVILSECGFVLSQRKFRVTKRGQAHYVTGLSVSDTRFPRAPRKMKKRLRQELYYCERVMPS